MKCYHTAILGFPNSNSGVEEAEESQIGGKWQQIIRIDG
jgi:hypothetical protein